MAPEQFRGDAVDQRVDIYALGVLLYQLLTGRYPFLLRCRGAGADAPGGASAPAQRAAPVSAEMDAVVLRCLEKRAFRRYPNVPAFVEALRAAVLGKRTAGPAARQGVAINVDLRIEGEEDESLLASLVQLLDETERQLLDAGYALYLQTGSALLGVKALPEEAAAARDERREALALGRRLLAPMSVPGADPRLRLAVQIHADAAEVRNGEVVSGPLVDVESWLQPAAEDLRATASATEDLEGW